MSLPVAPSTPVRGQDSAPGRGLALLRLGFRPFYIGSAAYAAIAVPVWVLSAQGWIELPGPLAPLLWHAHEMLFGFALAVVVGFLLTAARAWTGQATPRGPALGALALLWLAARLAAVGLPYPVYAALDMALLPIVAMVLLRVLLLAGDRRNLPLVGLLLLLTLANALFHAAALGWLAINPLQPLHAGLALIVMIECVMAGRVLPAFTMNATPGLKLVVPRQLPAAALAATALGLASWVLLPASWWVATPLALAGTLHAALLRWQPLLTRGRPMLWILHAAYSWIPAGLLLLALSASGVLSESAGIHALAVGATGGLVIGMVTRTARGHTGRSLLAGRAEVAAYALVMGAAALRVLLPLVAPAAWAWMAAALAWSLAFAVYLWVYAPWLASARIDGKDG